MPPASAAALLARQDVRSLDGRLQLKVSKHKGRPRLVVHLDTPSVRYSPVWLSRDVPHDRLIEVVTALGLDTDELTDAFKSALLVGAFINDASC